MKKMQQKKLTQILLPLTVLFFSTIIAAGGFTFISYKLFATEAKVTYAAASDYGTHLILDVASHEIRYGVYLNGKLVAGPTSDKNKAILDSWLTLPLNEKALKGKNKLQVKILKVGKTTKKDGPPSLKLNLSIAKEGEIVDIGKPKDKSKTLLSYTWKRGQTVYNGTFTPPAEIFIQKPKPVEITDPAARSEFESLLTRLHDAITAKDVNAAVSIFYLEADQIKTATADIEGAFTQRQDDYLYFQEHFPDTGSLKFLKLEQLGDSAGYFATRNITLDDKPAIGALYYRFKKMNGAWKVYKFPRTDSFIKHAEEEKNQKEIDERKSTNSLVILSSQTRRGCARCANI